LGILVDYYSNSEPIVGDVFSPEAKSESITSEEEDVTDSGEVELKAFKREGYSTYIRLSILEDSYPIEYEGRSRYVHLRELLIHYLVDNDMKIKKIKMK